jgi:hypothetical protein
MSASGKSRRFDPLPATSGLPRSTDVIRPARLVRFVPIPEVVFTRRSNGSTKQPLDVKGTVPPVGNFGVGGGTVQATNARRRYLTNRVGTVVLIDIK